VSERIAAPAGDPRPKVEDRTIRWSGGVDKQGLTRGLVCGLLLPIETDLPLDLFQEDPSSTPTLVEPLSRARRAAALLRKTRHGALATLLERLCDDAEATHRQVVRLGLDLHDGALQEIAALRADLHLFRDQVAAATEASEHRQRVVGRVDDFLARAAELDAALREVVVASQGSAILRRPLTAALADAVAASGGRCDVRLELPKDLDEVELTDSQRIAIVRIVQSALANVAQHSGAATTVVSIRFAGPSVDVEVIDDGVGFDVAAELRRAVDTQRFGLIGMRERVRLLGGELELESRPGGPSRVWARLPRRR
jgi:signal transduction histidine kinase